MSDSNAEGAPAELRCPRCGAPVTRMGNADADSAGQQQVELQCSNRHRSTVLLLETDDDDLGAAR